MNNFRNGWPSRVGSTNTPMTGIGTFVQNVLLYDLI